MYMNKQHQQPMQLLATRVKNDIGQFLEYSKHTHTQRLEMKHHMSNQTYCFDKIGKDKFNICIQNMCPTSVDVHAALLV